MADIIESVVRTGVFQNGKELLLVTEVPKTIQNAFQVLEEDLDRNIQYLNLQIIKKQAEMDQATLVGDSKLALEVRVEIDIASTDKIRFSEIKQKIPAKEGAIGESGTA